MTSTHTKWVIASAIVIALGSALLLHRDASRPSSPEPESRAGHVPRTETRASAEQPDPTDASTFEMPPPASEATPLAPAQPPTVDRILLRATYGDEPHQLGLLEPGEGFDGDIYPPQGFAPLPDGRLLVLDTAKTRLTFFSSQGHLEASWPLPSEFRLPADVVVMRDGAIAVIDHEGVETTGTVMLDSASNVKARLPQLNALMTDAYAAGNDLFVSSGVLMSVKVGDTSGSASDETPGLFNQNGSIPGRVAPDGRTVVHVSIVRGDKTQLLVSAITGEEPEHLFSRGYGVGEELRSISSVQIDGAGVIYVVIRHGGQQTLLCLEGERGDPIGHVALPRHQGRGTPFSPFVVPESGGLMMQQLQPDGAIYHFIDCRPGG